MKQCSSCGELKPLSEFHKDKTKKDGRVHRCKPCCMTAYTPEMRRKHSLRKFGITPEVYDSMYHRQRGRCAICQKHSTEEGKNLAVDHNHETGKVRGLLCMKCNTALGRFGDDAALLSSALTYLLENNG